MKLLICIAIVVIVAAVLYARTSGGKRLVQNIKMRVSRGPKDPIQ